MKYFWALFFVLSFTSGAMAQTKPEWFPCNNDRDCVVVGKGCTASAVNRVYEDEASQYFIELGMAADCPYVQASETPTAVCTHSKQPCKIKKLFGLVVEDDPASTCVSAAKKCVLVKLVK